MQTADFYRPDRALIAELMFVRLATVFAGVVGIGCLAAGLAQASPILAAQTQYVYAPEGLSGINQVSGASTSTLPFTFVNPDNGTTASITGSGELNIGGFSGEGIDLGVAAFLDVINAAEGHYSVRSFMTYSDIVSIGGFSAPTAITIRFTFHLEGTLTDPGAAFVTDIQATGGFPGATLVGAPGITGTIVDRELVFLSTVNVFNDPVLDRYEFRAFLQAFVEAGGQSGPIGQTASGSSDFAATFSLVKVEILNAGTGAPVAGAVLLDSDGNPFGPEGASAIPEPATLVLLTGGLMGLIRRRRTRARAPAR